MMNEAQTSVGYASTANRQMPQMAGVESRQAEIPHQFERLERTLKGCMQGLDTLGGRLEASIMRPEPGVNQAIGQSEKLAAAPATSYGSRLQELTSIAAIVNDRIQSLTARLEV